MDIFVIDSVFLGKLSSIRIGHSETKLGTFRKNLSLLLFTLCVSLFHHFIIVINEAPRKFFLFFFLEQRFEIISRTCFLFVALLSK